MLEQDTVGQEDIDTKTETHGIVEKEPSGEGQTVKKPKEPLNTPEPTVTGNEKINILKHGLSQVEVSDRHVTPARVEFAIRNVTDITIATVVFEALFYDREGNILDTVEHKEVDLKPNASRGVIINCSMPESYKVKSYAVKTARTTTADIEKVQLRWHEVRTTEAGEEEVRGAVKNISKVKTDAALVATFYDTKKENIDTKVMILRSIEPNSIRQYHFTFKPQEGDKLKTFVLHIGDIVE